MKVSNPSYNYTPQFKSSFIKTLSQPANLKKPLERMTNSDLHCFKSYIHSMKFRMGITQQEIKEIFSKKGLEFIEATSEFFKQKLGFSENNAPPIFLYDTLEGGAPAGYIAEQNMMFLTTSYEDIPKAQLFGLLRHEYQHAIQNHDILRTEYLGEEAIDFYAEKLFNQQKDLLIDFAKNYSIKELIAQGLIDEKGAILVSELSRALEKDDILLTESILNKYKQDIVNSLKDFREKLILEKGFIKADSKQASLAREYFKDFKNVDYYDENGKLDLGKHAFKLTEIEAEFSQVMAEAEANQTCYIRQIKDNFEKIKTDKEAMDSVDREFQKRFNG